MQILFKASINIYKIPAPVTHDFKITQITIGDLHANVIKLIYFLIRNDIITMREDVYNHLVNLNSTPFDKWTESYLHELKAYLKAFVVCNKNVLVRILGDDLCDRGPLDLSILWFLEAFVQQSGLVQIHVSNHGFDFILYHELAIRGLLDDPAHAEGFAFFNKYGYQYSRSLNNLHLLFKKGWVNRETMAHLYEHVYRPRLYIMTYSICPGSLTTHLFSHAECGLETIECVREQLMNSMGEPAQTTSEIVQQIDMINHVFQINHANKNNICDRGTLNGGVYHSKMYSTKPLSAASAIGHLVWRREQEERPLVATPDRLKFSHSGARNDNRLIWFHGHNDTAKQTGHTFTLDTVCGKFLPSDVELKSEEYKDRREEYIDLVSDHVPFTMLGYIRAARDVQKDVMRLLCDNDKPTIDDLFSKLWNAAFRFLTFTVIAHFAQLEEYKQTQKNIVLEMVGLIPNSKGIDKELLFEKISSELYKPLESVYQVVASPEKKIANKRSFFDQPKPDSKRHAAPHLNKLERPNENETMTGSNVNCP